MFLSLIVSVVSLGPNVSNPSEPDRVFEGSAAPICWLSFSPDGNWLVGRIRADGTPAILWEVKSGKVSGDLAIKFRGGKVFGQASFSSDSKTLVSMFPDTPVRFWDVEKVKVRAELTIKGAGYGGMLTRDGKILIAIADAGEEAPGRIIFWDIAAKKEVGSIPLKDTTADLTLSADGKRLAARGTQTLYVWDADKKKLLHTMEQPDTQFIHVMAFSPNGERLASTGKHPLYVHFWDVDTGKIIGTVDMHAWKEKDICHVKTIAFSPDSKTAAMGGNGWIFFVDVERTTVFTQIPVKGVLSLAFSPDGKTIAAGCEDKTVKLFRAVKPKTDEEIYKK